MMQTIEEKLKLGRNETVEFLSTIDEISDLAKVAVSMANNKGGSIFLGINSKGKLIGILPEPEIKLIEEIYNFVEGKIVFESVLHQIKHYLILEISISKVELPLKLKTQKGSFYYFRVGDETLEANKIIASYLNLRKYKKSIVLTSEHLILLELMEVKRNLSLLYKSVNLKQKSVDSLLSELIYLNKVMISIVDKTLFYSKV